jgi:hypothetical protein
MKTYARIENGTVVELFATAGDMATMFHPSMQWAECVPGTTRIGDHYAAGAFTAATVPVVNPNDALLAQIAALEVGMTPRRMRDAFKGGAGMTWITALDTQIAALRAQLK